jgi:hypothetical protein
VFSIILCDLLMQGYQNEPFVHLIHEFIRSCCCRLTAAEGTLYNSRNEIQNKPVIRRVGCAVFAQRAAGGGLR